MLARSHGFFGAFFYFFIYFGMHVDYSYLHQDKVQINMCNQKKKQEKRPSTLCIIGKYEYEVLLYTRILDMEI